MFATGERAVSEPYYSHRARSVCVSLSAFSLLLFWSHSIAVLASVCVCLILSALSNVISDESID